METPRPAWLVYGVVAAIGAGLLYYSQTAAFAWDEGFHLLAAQLIKAGKRPYADFFFAQAPLNAYLNAFWMSLFGETWRAPHAVDAVFSSAAVFLVAQYVWSRFTDPPGWRVAAAVVAAVSVGLNVEFVEFSTLQAYGPALFFSVAAFRVTVLRRYFFVAGVLAGAAAGCTLLTAPVALVLLVWIWFCGAEAPRRLSTNHGPSRCKQRNGYAGVSGARDCPTGGFPLKPAPQGSSRLRKISDHCNTAHSGRG